MFDWFLLLPCFKAKGGINHSSTQKHILHGLLLLNYTWMWEELKGFLVCVYQIQHYGCLQSAHILANAICLKLVWP